MAILFFFYRPHSYSLNAQYQCLGTKKLTLQFCAFSQKYFIILNTKVFCIRLNIPSLSRLKNNQFGRTQKFYSHRNRNYPRGDESLHFNGFPSNSRIQPSLIFKSKFFYDKNTQCNLSGHKTENTFCCLVRVTGTALKTTLRKGQYS